MANRRHSKILSNRSVLGELQPYKRINKRHRFRKEHQYKDIFRKSLMKVYSIKPAPHVEQDYAVMTTEKTTKGGRKGENLPEPFYRNSGTMSAIR